MTSISTRNPRLRVGWCSLLFVTGLAGQACSESASSDNPADARENGEAGAGHEGGATAGPPQSTEGGGATTAAAGEAAQPSGGHESVGAGGAAGSDSGGQAGGVAGANDLGGSAPMITECTQDHVSILGSADGRDVAVSVPWKGRVIRQLNGGSGSWSFEGGYVNLVWQKQLPNNVEGAVTGDIKLTDGRTFCIDAGTLVLGNMDGYDKMTISSLSQGDSCPGTPVSGELRVCSDASPSP